MTVNEARRLAADILEHSPVLNRDDYSSARDTLVLLAYFSGKPPSWLLAHAETVLDDGQASDFIKAAEKRATGIPVAYITGIKEFWGLPFTVTPSVLIPKPDTEILVQRAIEIIKELKAATTRTLPATFTTDATSDSDIIQVLDVCTGSGCIAVSLLHDCPCVAMTALDISEEALVVARNNAKLIDEPIRFLQGDLRDGLPPPEDTSAQSDSAVTGYHLIVSNPPYVPSLVARELLNDGRGEPLLALDGGEDGLSLVRPLIDGARRALAPKGKILIETGEYNAKETAAYLTKSGFVDIVIHRDLEGQDRVVEGRLP